MALHRCTVYGVAAILLWSCVAGLVRMVAEQFSPTGGAALIYTVASVFLVGVMGIPRMNRFSLRYLIIGGTLFVSYEICLALALGMAHSRHQALEMSVINYLWPALTVLFTVISSRQPVSRWVYPCILVAFLGVAWAISGDSGLSLEQIADNVSGNPMAYTMAALGAVIWAVYCNVTRVIANGQNAVTLFFIATALTLWVKYVSGDEPALQFTVPSALTLVLTAVVMGSGYALWNQAILAGNMLLLATLSYFTPVFSTLFSCLILGVVLGSHFWQGVVMVTLASLVCWWVTRHSSPAKQPSVSPTEKTV